MSTSPSLSCESCSMPIESGRYCEHCTDADGNLQSFAERFAAMTSWQARREPSAERARIEADTIAWMSTMPAWRDHPEVLARLAR